MPCAVGKVEKRAAAETLMNRADFILSLSLCERQDKQYQPTKHEGLTNSCSVIKFIW